jgi:VanZ family protein
MLNKLITLFAWTMLVFIAYATLSPIQSRPTLPTSVHFEHIIAFGVLGILFCLSYPRQATFACVIVFGSAALLEVCQLFTPDRHGRLFDAVEKLIGGALGIAVGRLFLRFKQRNS